MWKAFFFILLYYVEEVSVVSAWSLKKTKEVSKDSEMNG